VSRSLLACLCALAFLAPLPAAAQSSPSTDQGDNARFHFGPIRFTPFLAITDVGVDTNVYNEADDPKQDTTATLGPGLSYWFKLGRAHVAAKSDLTYTWFHDFSDQRSLNSDNTVTLTLPLNRVMPFVDGTYDHGRVRPGFEIDTRAFRTLSNYGGGFDVRVTGKSSIRLEGHHGRLDYRDDEYFRDRNLAVALNQTMTTAGASLRESLTPLTTLIVKGDYEQERFIQSIIKDANALKVMAGFELDPMALVAGRAFIGFKRFEPVSSLVPDYQGLVADVGANYRTHATRVDLSLSRDVQYSYEEVDPYYLLTDLGVRVTQKVTSHWDLAGAAGRQWLGYRSILTGPGRVANTSDHGYRAGGGVGYELGQSVRIGVNVDYYSRTSNEAGFREYNGLRAGGSFTYGFFRQ
jgi:hypothetical protein